MDFTKLNMKCPCSTCNNIEMEGAGGSFGGRIITAKFRCPNCSSEILVVPISKDYRYELIATTEEERKEIQIKKLKEQTTLELAERINQIKSSSM